MKKNKYGFTVLELILVIVLLSILVAVIAPAISHARTKAMIKAKAAVDISNMQTATLMISTELLNDKGMKEISKDLPVFESKAIPGAKLWINYSKPVTLNLYFVEGDNFYSLQYMTEIAANGKSELSTEKPFTLGFWYEAGFGKIDEYAPRD